MVVSRAARLSRLSQLQRGPMNGASSGPYTPHTRRKQQFLFIVLMQRAALLRPCAADARVHVVHKRKQSHGLFVLPRMSP